MQILNVRKAGQSIALRMLPVKRKIRVHRRSLVGAVLSIATRCVALDRAFGPLDCENRAVIDRPTKRWATVCPVVQSPRPSLCPAYNGRRSATIMKQASRALAFAF